MEKRFKAGLALLVMTRTEEIAAGGESAPAAAPAAVEPTRWRVCGLELQISEDYEALDPCHTWHDVPPFSE